jgi:hypothetical protein
MGMHLDESLFVNFYQLGQAASVDRWQLALCIPIPAEGISIEATEGIYDLRNQLAASVRQRGEQRDELRDTLAPFLEEGVFDNWASEEKLDLAAALLPTVADLEEALNVSQHVIKSRQFEQFPSEIQDDLAFAYEATLAFYQTLVTLTHRLALQ